MIALTIDITTPIIVISRQMKAIIQSSPKAPATEQKSTTKINAYNTQ